MDSIAAVEDSLDHLEDVLASLLDTPLFDVTTKLDLLQSAKLQVLLPYVVNDLVFLYLKTRGLNPKHHAVVAELDRVKQYFEKIRKVEVIEKRKLLIDQQAATRFIKHAIKQIRTVPPPAIVSVQFAVPTAAALAKIEARNAAELDGSSDDDEPGLEIYDERQKEEEGKEEEIEVAEKPREMNAWQKMRMNESLNIESLSGAGADENQSTKKRKKGRPRKKKTKMLSDGIPQVEPSASNKKKTKMFSDDIPQEPSASNTSGAFPTAAALAKIEARNVAEPEDNTEVTRPKRRRGMDPWQGYSDSEDPPPAKKSRNIEGDGSENQPTKKKRKTRAQRKKIKLLSDLADLQEPSSAVIPSGVIFRVDMRKRKERPQDSQTYESIRFMSPCVHKEN